MVKTVNGEDTGLSMMYLFLFTGIVDFICKTVAPFAMQRVKDYYQKIKPEFEFTECKEKTSSITILVKISDHENVLGQALLDFITHHPHTKHITYKKQNFILNQTESIEIADDIMVYLKESKAVEETDSDIEQHLELFSYTKTTHQLRGFLDKLAQDYAVKLKNKLGDHIYYFNQHPFQLPLNTLGKKDYSKLPTNCVFTMKKFQTNRRFTNLFGPEMNLVKKRIDFFIRNKHWYDQKGVPYTLGLLLSGQAGAGKTSSIKCLANETQRHIININLNNDISKVQFENLFFNELIHVLNTSTGQTEKYTIPLDQRIYVLEDIDCQSDLVCERANLKEESKDAICQGIGLEKLDLSFLLNILDGVLELPGRIVIMTSNYIEHLDHALIRPGRIDVIAQFKKCLNETLIEMIEFFYDRSLSAGEKIQIRDLRPYLVSPAEMGKIMFEHVDDYRKVLEVLDKQNRIETREKENPILLKRQNSIPNDTTPIHNTNDTTLLSENNHIQIIDFQTNDLYDYIPNDYPLNQLSEL
jgi:DNA polymerase III delta prime subunit